MREFEVKLLGDNAHKGLRSSYTARRNTFGLVGCQNMTVEEDKLVIYQEVPFAVNTATLYGLGIDELAWPDPRLFQGREKAFMVYGDRIFILDHETWTPIEVSEDIYTVDDGAVSFEIVGGTPWEFIDMGKAWMFVNGMSAVMYHQHSAMTGGTDNIRGYSGIRVQTGCEFRGRMMLGGFDPEYSWHPTWKTFIESWAQEIVATFDTDISLGNNFVMWSPVGFDLFWMFYPATLGLAGPVTGAEFDGDRPWLFEMMMRNDMGWMPMPWKGTVLNLRPLGKGVMVYGDAGISYLIPSGELTTFGRIDFSTTLGVNNKGAVGGDDTVQVFLSPEGDLWRVEAEKAPVNLGYREFFKNNLDTLWTVSYVPHEKYFYISNGVETFQLTPWGLSSTKQLITSTVYRGGNALCLGSTLTDNTVLYTSDEFDNGSAEIDTLQWVKMGGNKTDMFECAIDYKYNESDDWVRSEYRPVNRQGAVFVGRGGKVFRVVMRVLDEDIDDVNDVQPPDWLVYTFKRTDKRFTRGINIMQMGRE